MKKQVIIDSLIAVREMVEISQGNPTFSETQATTFILQIIKGGCVNLKTLAWARDIFTKYPLVVNELEKMFHQIEQQRDQIAAQYFDLIATGQTSTTHPLVLSFRQQLNELDGTIHDLADLD